MRGKETEKHMGRGKGVKNPIQVRWTFFTPTPLTPISLNPTKPWFPAQKHHWLIDHSCREKSKEKERSLLYTCCMFHFCFAGNSGVCLCCLDRKQTRFFPQGEAPQMGLARHRCCCSCPKRRFLFFSSMFFLEKKVRGNRCECTHCSCSFPSPHPCGKKRKKDVLFGR